LAALFLTCSSMPNEVQYLFTKSKVKAVRLACGVQTAAFKHCNLNRFYFTKHADKYRNLTDWQQCKESDALPAKYKIDMNFFTKLHASRNGSAKASLSHIPRDAMCSCITSGRCVLASHPGVVCKTVGKGSYAVALKPRTLTSFRHELWTDPNTLSEKTACQNLSSCLRHCRSLRHLRIVLFNTTGLFSFSVWILDCFTSSTPLRRLVP